MSELYSYGDALRALLSVIPSPEIEELTLEQCRGRILAKDIHADIAVPPFDRSAMDGYALYSGDCAEVPARLEIVDSVPAGRSELPDIKRGQAAQIMTGAPLPAGCDAVQMVEKTIRIGNEVEILEPVTPGQNVARAGSEVRQGDTVLSRGRVLGSAEIGVLASFGFIRPSVFKLPSVSILSTGDEIVEIEEVPAFGQIRNSNAWMLQSQCRALGLQSRIFPVVTDDLEETRKAVRTGLEADLLLFTGGVSVGEHDYVHRVLKEAPLETVFHKVAIRPGKPVLLATGRGKLAFGLPGNPVSAFVTFELFVRPAVRKWSGAEHPFLPQAKATLCDELRQKPGRLFFRPGRLAFKNDRFEVTGIATKGSADLVGFAQANALILMPADVSCLPAGSQVKVLLLERFFLDGDNYEADTY